MTAIDLDCFTVGEGNIQYTLWYTVYNKEQNMNKQDAAGLLPYLFKFATLFLVML